MSHLGARGGGVRSSSRAARGWGALGNQPLSRSPPPLACLLRRGGVAGEGQMARSWLGGGGSGARRGLMGRPDSSEGLAWSAKITHAPGCASRLATAAGGAKICWSGCWCRSSSAVGLVSWRNCRHPVKSRAWEWLGASSGGLTTARQAHVAAYSRRDFSLTLALQNELRACPRTRRGALGSEGLQEALETSRHARGDVHRRSLWRSRAPRLGPSGRSRAAQRRPSLSLVRSVLQLQL